MQKEKMASDHSMTQCVTQAETEATKAAMMVVREVEGPADSRRPVHAVPSAGGTVLRQSSFDWIAQGKYNGCKKFKIKVRNIF